MGILSQIDKLREQAEHSTLSLPALMIKSEKIADNIIHGEHAKRKSGSGEKFWQFREYDPSDRPQDIDWRQSAKGDQVFIKQKEWQITRKVFLWCAGGKSMDFSSNPDHFTKQETAQIIALSIALLLRKAKEQIGIFGETRTGRSEETINRISSFLFQRPEFEEYLPSEHNLTMPRHAYFIGIGDFLSPIEEIEHCFKSLNNQTQNAFIIQILDPAEIELNYTGRIRFKGVDNTQEVVNHVSSIREEYNQRIKDHIDAVKSLCHFYGWHYVLHITNDDIEDTLRNIWELMSEGEHQQK